MGASTSMVEESDPTRVKLALSQKKESKKERKKESKKERERERISSKVPYY